MLGHTALQSRIPAGVFARAEPGVAGNLTPIVKPAPIADLSVDDYADHFPQSAWLLWSGGILQLHREGGDLFLQGEQDRLTVLEQLFHPSRYWQRGKVASLPPVLHRLNPVIDHQSAPLGFQLFPHFDQLLPLPVDGAQLLFFFTGHTHQGQRITIALDKTVQL